MPAARKRETRENHFYNVGEQGRKTGIRLEDKGVRDEHGMEPLSGIFSSPEKSAKRSSSMRETIIESESMDIDDNTVPDLTPGHILRNSRTNLPPPRSRSPMKTALGSSPRRHSSIVPRGMSSEPASRIGINRRLDFEQESSLQETPPLSGSGARRGTERRDIYDLEQASPLREQSALLDESIVQQELMDEDSGMVGALGEESFAGLAEESDVAAGANNDPTEIEEESELVEALPKKRGRKRKSDVLQAANEEEEEEPVSRTKRRTSKTAGSSNLIQKKSKQPVVAKASGRPARNPRISDISAPEEPSTTDTSLQDDDSPVTIAPKRRGRPPKNQPKETPQAENQSTQPKARTTQAKKKADDEVFKKPMAISKPKAQARQKQAHTKEAELLADKPGKLVNEKGEPLSKADIDQISTASTATRFARGRSLSVFRQIAPDELATTIGRTGRHRLPPIDFWKAGEQVIYDKEGNLESVVRDETQELPVQKRHGGRSKGKRRGRAGSEDEEELERWELKGDVVTGDLQEWDSVTETLLGTKLNHTLAWSNKSVVPNQVPGADFKFIKLGSGGDNNFFSWGYIELPIEGIKRQKNSRRMHMVFLVTQGAVEVTVGETTFTVHKNSCWQVPRGSTYSISNVARGDSRIFFSQAFESRISADE